MVRERGRIGGNAFGGAAVPRGGKRESRLATCSGLARQGKRQAAKHTGPGMRLPNLA